MEQLNPYVSEDSEQNLLSAILNDPDSLYEIDRIVNDDDFYFRSHQIIFQGVRYLFNKNAYDIRTLVQLLKDRDKLDEVGGVEYVSQLRGLNAKRHTAKVFAFKIKEMSMYRCALHIAERLKDEVENAAFGGDKESFASQVNAIFNSFDSIKENKMRHVAEVNKTAKEKSKERTISPLLGFKVIDNWMRGIGNERLIVIAGRPGTGKTAFSLTACRNISGQGYGAVPVFSMEMSGEELVNRILADLSGVPFQTICNAEYQGYQEQVVDNSRKELDKLPLYIDDSSRIDYDYIVSQCRRLKREHGSLGAVMIDYLGLVKIHEKKNRNKADAIGDLTADLKRLTRELGCSIILLVQMNREVDKRSNKRPVLSDLRDSGSIEQDADMVIFLHKDPDKSSSEKSHIDFIVEKGRQTGVADFELWFNGVIQRFEVKT